MAAKDSDPRLGELGQYIRLQRQLADLSLRRMAELTKVSNAYLSQVERGLHQPSLRVLRSIAEALDISAETLLAQAGLLADSAPTDRRPTTPRVPTEQAIMSDADLTQEERELLVAAYRGFIARRSSSASA